MELLSLVQKDIIATKRKRIVPEGKLLFIFDPPGSYNRAIGIVIDDPNFYRKGGF